jgi:hypothetical protein
MEEKDILSQIKEGRTVSKSMVEEVNKDILKNKEDALKKELATALVDSEYNVSYSKLKLKRARAIEEVERTHIQETGENRESLMAGGLTPEEYNKKQMEVDKKREEELLKVKQEYNVYLRQLNDQNPDISWDTRKNSFNN